MKRSWAAGAVLLAFLCASAVPFSVDAVKGAPGSGRSSKMESSAPVQQKQKKDRPLRQEPVSEEGPDIEVGLLSGQDKVSVTGLSDFTAEQNGKTWQSFKKGTVLSVSRAGKGVSLNGKKSSGPVYLKAKAEAGASFSVKGSAYRGEIKLIPSSGGVGVTAVNVLPMEQYLCGVVPREVSPQWNTEALKAQAVAARTYAVYQKDTFRTGGYDVTDDTRSQVYGGYSAEAAQTTKAVKDTEGEVVTYQGKPIEAMFHANAGGHTENSENVWGNQVPYLRGVEEPKSSVTGKAWTKTVTLAEFSRLLDQAGYGVGTLKKIELSKLSKTPMNKKDRGVSGRVKFVTVSGKKGKKTVPGSTVQGMLGLSSTLFDFSVKGKNLTVTGYGAGHGLGLSQWGAEAMAEEKKNQKDYYKTILTHYFTGTKVEKIY